MSIQLQEIRTIDLVVRDMQKEIFSWIARYSKRVKFQKKSGSVRYSCRGGAAIGYKQKGKSPVITVKNLNSKLPDFWEGNSQYGCYAGYKCITALMNEKDTSDTGEEFSFDGAFHAGGCVVFLAEYNAFVSISFSGFESPEDKIIAFAALKEFFIPKE